MGVSITVKHLFDQPTYTLTYIVFDNESKDAVIIDPVIDFDSASGKLINRSLDRVMEVVQSHGLNVHYILETHAHADHISGAHAIQSKHLPTAKIAISDQIVAVQSTFKSIFNFGPDFDTTGAAFDQLLAKDESFYAGSLPIKVLSTPGHTPACVTYLIGQNIFTGDALFTPDFGTGRCDFPDGSAETLYSSITEKLYTLPESTAVYVGHDYQPNGRELIFKTSIAEQKGSNIHLSANTSKEEFVAFRTQRDAKLSAPQLLFPSIQINCQAGRLPGPESNKTSYLKIPIEVVD